MKDILERIREKVLWLLPSRLEEDSERDGFLSTTAEWHVIMVGFFRGYRNGCLTLRQKPSCDKPRIEDESGVVQEEIESAGEWYWKLGFILGDLTQIALVILLIYLGYEAL